MNKQRTRQFGILVFGMIKSAVQKKSIQKLGILTLSIAGLLGVTQASAIRKIMSGATQSEASVSVQQMTPKAVPANRTTENSSIETDVKTSADERLNTTNIVDLIGDSELIVRGSVKKVADGIENGVPYTEITVQVSESLRGRFEKEYTYRQFGLLKPRSLGNGKVNLNVTPDGWSKYSQGEDVVLFLYKRAAKTGLRTTVGLGQGKLAISGGNVSSQFDNVGLFDNVEVDTKLLNDRDKRLLGTKKGPVNKESFMSFVRKAVKDKWIEGGKLRNAKK
jgi:hypothetical protein